MAGGNWTFWLNMTNFALGIVTVLAVLVVAGAVSWDLFFMWLHKVRTGDAVDINRIDEAVTTVVDELIPNVLTMGAIHRVLSLLLEEGVPISNLTRILESLAHHAPNLKDPVELAEPLRGRRLVDGGCLPGGEAVGTAFCEPDSVRYRP